MLGGERGVPWPELMDTGLKARVQGLRRATPAESEESILLEVAKVLHSTTNIEELLNLIIEKAIMLTNADRGCLIVVEPGRGYRIEVAQGKDRQVILPESFRVSTSVIERVLETQQAFITQDILAESGFQSKESIGELGIRMVLCAPMNKEGNTLGLIYVDALVPGQQALPERLLRVLDTLAGQAAVALFQARLFEEIQAFSRKVQELDAAKLDFIAIASHEMRTPVSVVQGYAEMIRHTPNLDRSIQQIVEPLIEGARRLSEIVNAMLEVAQIDQNELTINPRPYSLKSLIRDVVAKWQETIVGQRELTLEIVFNVSDEDVVIWTVDSDAMGRVLDHLLQNSIKFTPDGGTVKVRLSRVGKDARIEVIDTGIGIDPSKREVVFEKFYRDADVRLHSTGKVKFKGAGPGLGLFLVRGIVQRHQGQVWVEDNQIAKGTVQGSKFIIQLPE